jgi:hypothetical protein
VGECDGGDFEVDRTDTQARSDDSAQKSRPGSNEGIGPGRLLVERIPAITDFRAEGTIMGLAGLTAVFGMGTGVTPPVWSPEKWPADGQAEPSTVVSVAGRTEAKHTQLL